MTKWKKRGFLQEIPDYSTVTLEAVILENVTYGFTFYTDL